MLKNKVLKPRLHKKDGQSTVEYLILVGAVIAVIVVFLGPNGPFSTAYNDTLQRGTNGMVDMATRLGGSRGAPPANG